MHKKKIAAMTMAIIISNFSATTLEVLADEISNNTSVLEINDNKEVTKAVVNKFDLYNSDKLNDYNSIFKIDNSKIKSITNNGGQYSNSSIDKAIDNNLNTHWETGKQNNSEFTNEVVFTFNETTDLNRIVYAARQDGAKGKGFAQEFEIYSSLTDDGDDFILVSEGEYKGSTGDLVEIKFNSAKFKRLKFKFKKANQEWASASEFMLYKEDKIYDKVKKLFEDSSMNSINEEFNSIEKINALEEEAKNHPLYEDFKEDIDNAKLILENKEVKYIEANISKFEEMDSENISKYDEIYKLPLDKITKIKTNGSQYSDNVIQLAIDGDVNTKWHSGKKNSSDFTNEVIIELDELTTLNRITYTSPRGTNRGFAEEFEIYASRTSKGDTFERVSSGTMTKTQDTMEIRFNPTEFKRVKFVYKKGYEDWACAAEFGLYKQDELSEKMDRLFTDSSMSEVSDEFNSLDKITALENEVNNHIMSSMYKEDLENAKILINQQKVEATTAVTKKFEHYSNEEYSNLFKMDNNNIKSIRNNAGNYSNQVITNAIDGNLDTYWETNKANTSEFTNEVEVEFKETVELDKIVYGARKSDNKGFAKDFEIYGSTTSKGDTYQLIATGSHEKVSGLVEAKFKPTKFKRVKFKFKNSDQNWATLSEIAFYKQDKIAEKVASLFTNGLMNELSEEFNTLDKIQALEKEATSHPLKELFIDDINLAKDIINNKVNLNKTIELERRGNSVQEANKRKLWGFKDWQVTGLTARPGDVLEIYVDVKDGEPTPSLLYKQALNRHGGSTTFNLVKGKNTIVIPEYNNEADDVIPGTIYGGALYFTNYESDKQTVSPKVRIEGAKQYPMYVDGKSNDEQVMKDLEEYVNKINEDPSNTVDVFDVSTNQTLVTVKATDALQWYKDNDKMPSFTANNWERVMDDVYEFWGFDNSTELNSRFNSRMIFMPKNLTNGVFMNAGGGIVGVGTGSQDALLSANRGWGLMHEIGHNMDTAGRAMPELTNNILPIYMATVDGNVSRITTDNVWERKIYPKVTKQDYSDNLWQEESGEDSLAQLSPLWQLNLYDNTFYPKFEQVYRANDFNLQNRQQIIESWVKVSSDILELNLYEFFSRHGIHASEEIKEAVSKYPEPNKKLWYLNDNKLNYDGNGFSEDTNLDVSLSRVDNEIKLTFNIDDNSKSDLLGYEILKDGEVIGFTSTNTFIDTDVDKMKNSRYEVIPYDNNLGTCDSVIINSFAPTIITQQKKITLKLREEFNPMDYIKVLDNEGNDITFKVEVEHNVNTNNKGLYQVKYTVNDKDLVSEKIIEIEVVSDYDYLSDDEWKSVETQWGTPRRNSNIKGMVNQGIKTFEKGFGIHANGKIIYDLSNKDYDTFEALIGVDPSVGENSNSSITFKVLGDGKTLATTNVMKYSDDMAYISVPVKGVKELIIEVNDGGNGNTCDHGVIANPKLTTNNAKPKINVGDKALKLGEKIDLMNEVTAIDAEDGNITSKLQVSGKVNFNKSGKYPITYRVTDSDSNVVEKTITISVVNMDDYKYLTEYDWKSANCGWGSVNKDKAVSGNMLRLTDKDNNEVAYEKGIGTHATSTIIYDLSDKDYSYFTSYIGVDRAMYGTVGSVEFKVYVDGNLKYESGLMNSRDPQKYIEVDINGAKELKLVATDGGNGNGSDHATWANTKLHFANEEVVDYKALEDIVLRVNEYDKHLFTPESFEVLEIALNKANIMIEDKISSQDEVNLMIEELNSAIENLEENIDLNEIVNIKDKYLKLSIKKELNLSSDTITVGDMQNLIRLNVQGAESLEGLQYAKNLESLNIEYNEINDLSPLKDLKKLTDLKANPQIISAGTVYKKDNNLTIDYDVLNRKGEKLLPTKIIVRNNKTLNDTTLNIEECLDEKGMISFDATNFDENVYSVYLGYEDTNDNYLAQVLFMFDNR